MKAWKTVLIAVIFTVALSLVSAQSCIACLAAAVVAGFGPRRLKSLPRQIREDAALHLLGVLAAAFMAVVISLIGKLVAEVELEALLSLAAWMCIGVMVLLGAFHLENFPPRPVVCRQPVKNQMQDQERCLPRAS